LQTPDGGSRTLQDWGSELLEACAPMAAALDAAHGGEDYRAALDAARQTLAEPDSTPSARVLAAMAERFDNSYVGFVRQQSEATRALLLDLPYSAELAQRFAEQAAASLAEQARIEQADTLPFEAYRQQYLAPERMEV